MTEKALTPMMEQYVEVKAQIPPEALLLFRLGDFYEMFGEDAEKGSRLLGITLTQRHGDPMAGIPYHAATTYISRLLQQGVKVAICDQVETPQPGKLVRRGLTRIITPGTVLEDPQLEATLPRFLLALGLAPRGAGLTAAWADVSAGEFWVAPATDPVDLLALLERVDPSEVLLPEILSVDRSTGPWHSVLPQFLDRRNLTIRDDVDFDATNGSRKLREFFNVLNLSGYGFADPQDPALGAAGCLLTYLEETFRTPPRHFQKIRRAQIGETLLIDPATSRNLDIFHGSDGTRHFSLLEAVDQTVTAPGSRLLVELLTYPLKDLTTIRERQDCVEAFFQNPLLSDEIRITLKKVRDLPRILSRLQNRLQSPRELAAIRETLHTLPSLKERLAAFPPPGFPSHWIQLPPLDGLCDLLTQALADDPPVQLADGGAIREGYDTELDRLRNLTRNSKSWVAEQEQSERERTGLKNLKIKFNNAFGYFIELPKSQASSAPAEYVRRQTLVNAERFTTPELKEKEREILQSEEASLSRETELFQTLIDATLKEATALRTVARFLAELDVFAGWGVLARQRNYTRPVVDDSEVLDLKGGRHPVVEQQLDASTDGLGGSDTFVANDCLLDASGQQIILLTGPNMAGKSTYIRQVALLALLAQTGCWVPATSLRLGWVDRIFSRVGASDELARGNSTFMVEMNETANILHHATARSLIILDEVGRGTSTYDGMSIAWAVAEHLHGGAPAGPRTLFATHYHELTELEKILPRLANYTVAVREWEDRIIFLRQVIKGSADRSYGIQVARLAGLPEPVLARATELLAEFEGSSGAHPARQKAPRERKQPPAPPQLDLFGNL
jgi:DNA mismatch repair protein MutS